MQIRIELYASFRIRRFKCELREFPAGAVLGDVPRELGIGETELGIALLNGTHARLDAPLRPGDVVSLMPRIGGG